MRWFGESWGAPINDDLEHTETPVGQRCLWCEEEIAASDSGVLMWSVRQDLKASFEPEHRECFLRGSIGSVGHQMGICSCPGKPGLMDDPPGLSKRQAALAAVEEFERSHHL